MEKPNYLQKLQYDLGLNTLEETCALFKKVTKMKLSTSSLSRYERGYRISEDKFLLLAKTLNLSPYKTKKLREFFDDSEENPLRNRAQNDKERATSKKITGRKPTGIPHERFKTKPKKLNFVTAKNPASAKPQLEEIENYLFLIQKLKPILGDSIEKTGVRIGIFQIAVSM